MEIKTELLKPYSEQEKMTFIINQNHKNGYEIRETEESLQAWGYTEEEKQAQERERLDNLTLTGADVERAIYEAKGMDFDDLVAYVIKVGIPGFDVKRLRIELKANNFYRKHEYINMLGQLLGYTSEDMDYLFETKHLPVKEVETEGEDNELDAEN